MASGCKFDLSTFQRGLRAKQKATKKTGAEIINRACGSTLANAIRLTPRANPQAIKAQLSTNGTAFRLLQSPAMQGRLPKKLVGFTKGTHTRAQINAAAAKFIQLKAASSGYIRAGWFKALAVFRPGSARKVSSKSLAGRGRARKATPGRLSATFENFSRGVDKVGAAPLQRAMNEEGRSMLAYAAAKLASAWK